jgi:uncharacterized protein (TIGR03435 family)
MQRVRHFGFVLALFGALSAGAITAQAQSHAPETVVNAPKFEVASVRIMEGRDKLSMAQQMFSLSPPGAAQFTVRNTTLDFLICNAFKVCGFGAPIVGMPAWMDSTYYELSAKPEGDAGLSYDQVWPLMQELLQERFHLRYHMERKSAKGYALVVAAGGSKLAIAKGAEQHAYLLPGKFDVTSSPVSMLAGMLSHVLGVPVEDETGLAGNFDFKLNYAPMEATDSTLPSLSTAVGEQLGLKLVRQIVPVEMFVIDHVDRVPTEN